MSLKAVIKTGGKQYLVQEGDILDVEKIEGKKDKKISFKDVLLVFDKDKKIEIGKPKVKASVEALILEQKKDPKIRVIKYKPKTRYHKTRGHRQLKTKIKITKINQEKKASSKVSSKKTDKPGKKGK